MMRVLVFGPLKDAIGSDIVELNLATPTTPRKLLEKLCSEHPQLAALFSRCRIAVDGEYADQDQIINGSEEVALIPPVSGGSEGAPTVAFKWRCELTEEPIDVNGVLSEVIDEHVGAVALFIGVVRGHSNGKEVVALEYDAYKRMAERKLCEIAEGVCSRHGLERLIIIHRVGRARVGEVVVVIAASSAHRHEAIEACREAIERIKADVPMWKKEILKDGYRWVIT